MTGKGKLTKYMIIIKKPKAVPVRFTQEHSMHVVILW